MRLGKILATHKGYAASQSYACNNGDAANGSSCSHQTATQAASNYSCAVGNVLPGNLCAGATNSTKTAYIYLGNRQIAEAVVGGATQYVHTDALGSPVAHTNASGVKTDATKYEPYGYTAMGTKPGPNTSVIGFTGHVNDPETDLVYMQQRYYDPIAGRFLSVDPVVTNAGTGKSFGRYAYANNRPYVFVDPNGEDPQTIAAVAADKVGQGGWGKPGYRGGLGWFTEFKCNRFVQTVIEEAGDRPPLVNGRMATAGELADPLLSIDGWEVVLDGSVRDGDIIAMAEPGDGYSGHTGIIVKRKGKPFTVSADSNQRMITQGQFGFRAGDAKHRVIRRQTEVPEEKPKKKSTVTVTPPRKVADQG